MKAMYLPWVLLAWTLLLGGVPVSEFIGICVGHLYYFLEHLYPVTSGVNILKTPQILSISSLSLSLSLCNRFSGIQHLFSCLFLFDGN